jgi:Recombinase
VAELEAGVYLGAHRGRSKSCQGAWREVRSLRCGGSCPQYRQEALQRAEELEPVITELREKDDSLAKIARELNKRKVATPRGGRWDHSSVRNVLKRLEVDSAG